ncbi:probable ATP-dependent RNA helicase DDX58 [Lingula anatina]|uniref:Probable ATP-dependent RNA helicase DDX58 n=1 Tax=Lingula anatina TaxID=7574 RepID=A0A1S3IZN5_LINAN|nr:probable ATP-dependent RNA helicase DDX58 [Lingula anatina]|eukprot:XP_013403655.1 probable ATP-dependent RNA helicase DDX58 [Lingula anatina]
MDNSQPREECDEVGQGDSHIDKFQLQREILTVCSTVFIDKIQPVELCVHLSDIIGKAEEDKIKAATDEKGPRKGAELLLSFVLESTDPGWFTVFVNGLRETGSETALGILEDFKALSDFSQHVNGMKYDLNSVRFEDLHEKHLRVFRPHIIEYLEPIQLLPHLIQRGVLSNSTVDRIRAETRNKGRFYGSLMLLRHLPTLKNTWYTDFLYSLWDSGNQKDKELVQLIDPDFNPDWKQYQTSQKRTVTKEIAGDTIDAVPPKCRKYGSADEGRNITGAEVEQVSLKLSDLNITDELSLRNYQHELAEPALRGQNCIIVAPTGSGKTRVAAHIVAEHLKQGADRKVVFMACKVPLVQQQYQLFCQLFEKYELRVLKVCGDDESNKFLHQLISEFDIIVLTPQILENHLLENTISSLDVFSLLIFDECHHTQKASVKKTHTSSVTAQDDHPEFSPLTLMLRRLTSEDDQHVQPCYGRSRHSSRTSSTSDSRDSSEL